MTDEQYIKCEECEREWRSQEQLDREPKKISYVGYGLQLGKLYRQGGKTIPLDGKC